MDISAKSHIGRKISRLRELRGMKQEAMAQALGVTQQRVSIMENSAEIDDKRLAGIAEALGVSLEGLKNFSQEAVLTFFTSNDSSTLIAVNFQPNFNPLDKLMEVIEENKKLYEGLLEAEREKVALMERWGGRKRCKCSLIHN